MKEPYMKGVAAPSWPRVMRGRSWGCTWSVDRGECRPGIELRKHPLWGAERQGRVWCM